MSCWTGYLLRDEDGSCFFSCVKRGDCLITDDNLRAAVIAAIRRDGVPLVGATAGGFNDSCCQGVAIDVPHQRYRYFPCAPSVRRNEICDAQVRAAPAWRGWDAGLAWGGREDLVDLLPEAREVVASYGLRIQPLSELPVGDRAEWFVDWNSDRLELRYGLAGHLAATGQRGDEFLDDTVLTPADSEWLAARRALVVDPRPLRQLGTRVVRSA